MLGRHRKALAHLGLLFKHGKVGKTYWAVVEGGPEADEGTIDLPLGRLDETRGWWMKPDPQGLPSVTTWKVLGRTSSPTSPAGREAKTTHLARPHAGDRPHPPAAGSLRRHGWPIVGDNIYGTAPRFGGPMQQLHAREVVVPISKNKPPVRVVAPVPAHMRDRLGPCGWNGEDGDLSRSSPSCVPAPRDHAPGRRSRPC